MATAKSRARGKGHEKYIDDPLGYLDDLRPEYIMLQPHHVTVRRVAERYGITDKPARLFIQNLEARGVLVKVGYAFDGHKLAVWERVENAKAKQD